jgi:glycosyltransferase involved in cell wall biosynthesis
VSQLQSGEPTQQEVPSHSIRANEHAKRSSSYDMAPGWAHVPPIGPIIFPFTGFGVGGSHISTFNLARSLGDDCGLRSVIVAVEGTPVAQEAARFGLKVHTISSPPARTRSILSDISNVPTRRRILKQYGSHAILHCNDLWTLRSWGVPAKMLGMPVIYHHRQFVKESWSNRRLIAIADTVVSISEACRRNLAFLADDRVHNIVNPFPEGASIDTSACRADLESEWPGDDAIVLVGFIGSFVRRKRPDFFLDICRALAERDPRIRFVLTGRDSGFTSDALSAHARKLGLSERTFLAGFRSPPERNIAPLDVMVAPALAEPFGRTLVEAMLLGVPYVATADAGHTEIFSRWGGGRIVERAATADQFADEIMRTLASRNFVVLSEEKRRQLAEEVSPRSHARKVLDVYRSILAR